MIFYDSRVNSVGMSYHIEPAKVLIYFHLAIIILSAKFLYAQVSYMILARVSPVTHSIGNCLKRVIVIVASVIFFKNPVSQQNIIGKRRPKTKASMLSRKPSR